MLNKCPLDRCAYPYCPKGKICDTPIPQLLEIAIKERDAAFSAIQTLKTRLINSLNEFNRSISIEADLDACPYGCLDCIHNPEFDKKYDYDYWAENGFPVQCQYISHGEIDKTWGHCPYYDDEDK